MHPTLGTLIIVGSLISRRGSLISRRVPQERPHLSRRGAAIIGVSANTLNKIRKTRGTLGSQKCGCQKTPWWRKPIGIKSIFDRHPNAHVDKHIDQPPKSFLRNGIQSERKISHVNCSLVLEPLLLSFPQGPVTLSSWIDPLRVKSIWFFGYMPLQTHVC